MSFFNLSINTLLTKYVISKKLPEIFYLKYLIRKRTRKKTCILDTNSSTKALRVKPRTATRGKSFIVNNITYKNCNLKNYSFTYLTSFGTKQNVLNIFLKTIKILETKKSFVVLTGPKKGGFKIFSCGIKGFIPTTEINRIIKPLKKQLLLCKIFFYFCKNYIAKSKYNIIYFPVNFKILTIHSFFRKRKLFSLSKKFKKFFFYKKKRKKNYLNFVFIKKKVKKKRILKKKYLRYIKKKRRNIKKI